jgi:hypothetical protein
MPFPRILDYKGYDATPDNVSDFLDDVNLQSQMNKAASQSTTCKNDLTSAVNAFTMSENLMDNPERILNEFVVNFCIKTQVAEHLKCKYFISTSSV